MENDEVQLIAESVREPSGWNYRIMARSEPTGGDDYESNFIVIEAYYDDDGTVVAWCDATPMGTGDVESLATDLGYMLEACQQAVLDYDDLPHSDGTRKNRNND